MRDPRERGPLVRGQQSADVFEEQGPGWPGHSANGVLDVVPQPSVIIGPSLFAGDAHGLAGEPGGEHVDRVEVFPRDRAQVAEVGDVRVPVREDLAGAGVEVGDERQAAAEDGLGGHVEAAVPGAQAADRQRPLDLGEAGGQAVDEPSGGLRPGLCLAHGTPGGQQSADSIVTSMVPPAHPPAGAIGVHWPGTERQARPRSVEG